MYARACIYEKKIVSLQPKWALCSGLNENERDTDRNRNGDGGGVAAERGSDLAQGSSFPFGAYLGESSYAAGGYPLCYLAGPRSQTKKKNENR